MNEKIILPDGFRAMIAGILGNQDADILLAALDGEPETAIRLNRRKTPSFSVYEGMTPVAWCPSAFYLARRPNFTLNPLFHAGAFYVQDASSAVYETIAASLGFEDAVMAADLCAAPGGKTTAILNALPEGSVMLANEFIGSRANALKENLCKYGSPDVVVTNAATSRLACVKGRFNLVAVDAPCSGEGMMRKEPAARLQWSEGLISQCSRLQREIIDNAVEMLAPGGFLIYSTCTFNVSENEDNAAYIASVHGLEPVDTCLAGKHGIRPQVKGNVPCLRFMPGFARGEGLFVAVFRKEGVSACGAMRDESSHKGSRSRKSRKDAKNTANVKIDTKILSLAKSWAEPSMEIMPHGASLLGLSPAAARLLGYLPGDVRILSAGVMIGEVKGNDLVPSHQLALCPAMSCAFPEVDLTEEEAIRYLSREAISLPAGTPVGFVAVTYRGFPLGFVKNLGTRSNNLYPADYRIRIKP